MQSSRFGKLIESESEEEVLSSSDSDSDANSKPKRAKIKPKVKLARSLNNPRRKKYDIWSTRIQEEVLSETFNSCDVTLKDRSRSVESYDYTLSRSYNFNDEDTKRMNNKRTRNDMKNPNLRLKNKKREEKEIKGSRRVILDLSKGIEDSIEDIAKDIANKLCEEKEDIIRKELSFLE